MSGSRWVITQSWLSCSWRSFLYSSSVYSCHLVLISSASLRSIPSLSFIEPIFAWHVPLVSLILLKQSLAFPILLSSSISLHWSLRKAFLSLLALLWKSAFKWVYLSFPPLPLASLLFTAICKVSSDNHFAFFHFFFLGKKSTLPPAYETHLTWQNCVHGKTNMNYYLWLSLFFACIVWHVFIRKEKSWEFLLSDTDTQSHHFHHDGVALPRSYPALHIIASPDMQTPHSPEVSLRFSPGWY